MITSHDDLNNEEDLENEDNRKYDDEFNFEDDLNPKMETCNFEGCVVYYLNKLLTTPHLDSHSKTDPKLEILSAI